MVILLVGPDSFRSLQRLRQLRQAFRDKHDPTGFNTVSLDGDGVTLAALRDALMSGGLFSSRRMVIIDPYVAKRGGIKPDRLVETLRPFLDHETIVIIREVTSAPTDRRRAPKASLNIPKAKVETFPELTVPQAEKWVAEVVKQAKGKMVPAVIRFFVATVGTDTWKLHQEIEKILTYVAGTEITQETVAQLTTGQLTSDVFALLDAIGQRRPRLAATFIQRELQSGTHPLALVSTIRRHLETLANVQALLPATPASVARELTIHPFVAQKAAAQAKNFTRTELVAAHDGLVKIDRQLKTTPLDGETLLTRWLYRR